MRLLTLDQINAVLGEYGRETRTIAILERLGLDPFPEVIDHLRAIRSNAAHRRRATNSEDNHVVSTDYEWHLTLVALVGPNDWTDGTQRDVNTVFYERVVLKKNPRQVVNSVSFSKQKVQQVERSLLKNLSKICTFDEYKKVICRIAEEMNHG